MAADAAAERILRAKFLDWCSARLADRFLALSPDEIYELSRSESHGRDPVLGPALVAYGVSGAGLPVWLDPNLPMGVQEALDRTRDPESFRALVARVTETLSDTLPTFDEWKAAYQEDPKRFDDELLGLWRESL